MARYKHFEGADPSKFETNDQKVGGKDGCGSFYGADGGHSNPLPDKMTQLPNEEGKMTLSTRSLLDATIGDSHTGGLDGVQWSGSPPDCGGGRKK
jgi:hypothetical protein